MYMMHVPPLGNVACLVCVVTWLWLEDPWFAFWRGKRFLCSQKCRDQVWVPFSLPFNGCREVQSQRGKAAGAWSSQLTSV